MAKTKQNRTRQPVATVYDLAMAYQSRDKRAYRRLLENAKVSDDFKRRMTTKKGKGKTYKNPKFQEEEIQILRNEICKLDNKIGLQEEVRESAYEEVKKAQELVKAAEEKLKKANQIFKEQKEKEAALEKEKKSIEMLIAQEEKKLEKMQKFTLVHPTATLSSLDKKRETMIVCTDFDAASMGFYKFADYIFNCDKGNLLKKEELEQVRDEFETLEEFLSAVEYVKMFVVSWVGETDCELLYNSPGIKHMLDILGI